MNVRVIGGNIAMVESDALITAINSGGAWFGGIDNVISCVAGTLFHAQARLAMPLKDGDTVVASDPKRENNGKFNKVIFVVDDLERPLREIVHAGLHTAAEAGISSVTLPTIRMGVMLGQVEKSPEETLSEMAAGVQAFLRGGNYGSLRDITFVVYRDELTERLLRESLSAVL